MLFSRSQQLVGATFALLSSTSASPLAIRNAGAAQITPSPVTAATPVVSVPASAAAADVAAIPTLLPATHWDHPVDDINNLAPTNSSNLYYAANGVADPAIQHKFATMNTTLQYPSVVLNHSSYIDSVTCSGKGIDLKFTSSKGFQFAAQHWPSGGEDFVLVTNTEGCGNSTDQRTFWLIDSLSYTNASNTINAVVKEEIAIENALGEVDMVWGVYKPGDAGTATPQKRDDSVTKTADINLHAPTGASTPWGDGFKIFSEQGEKTMLNGTGPSVSGDVSVYCVDCGISSHIILTGHLKWSLFHGIETLTASFEGQKLSASFKLGLVAQAELKDTKTVTLINAPVPDLGVSIAKLFEAGLTVNVDATAELEIDAIGQALIGVTMDVADFTATLDIKDEDSGKNSGVTGWNPTFDKTFDIAGELSATATLSMPISLELGVKVPIAKWDKSIALTETPSLQGTAAIAGSKGSGSVPGVTCNDGISYSITAHNDISLNLFNLKTFDLEHYDSKPLISGCKPLTKSSGSGTATSSASSASKTPTAPKASSSAALAAAEAAAQGIAAAIGAAAKAKPSGK